MGHFSPALAHVAGPTQHLAHSSLVPPAVFPKSTHTAPRGSEMETNIVPRTFSAPPLLSSFPGRRAEGEASFCGSCIGDVIYRIPAAELIFASQQPVWNSRKSKAGEEKIWPHLCAIYMCGLCLSPWLMG